MKIAFFVHDFHLEIGHSNAMIEVLNNFPSESVEEIVIVAYSCSELDDLLPQFKGRTRFIRIPFTWLKPFLLRNLNYQILSFLYTFIFLNRHYHKIGIGTAAIHVNTTYVQFIHHQWKKEYLESQKYSPLRYVYKWILYNYFCLCENILYRRKNLKFVSIANFLTEYIQKKWPVPNDRITTIYSGVNLDRFSLPNSSRSELFEKMCQSYPQIKEIDIEKPIYLFVGAYERKGLPEALELLSKKPGNQIIIVGEPENPNAVAFPNNIKIACVNYTKEIPLFYALADCFVFPSKYEPFGLVVIEAAAMGMTVLVNRQNVGASEILGGLHDIYFIDEDQSDFLEKVKVLDKHKKNQIRDQRLAHLSEYEWTKTANLFYPFIES